MQEISPIHVVAAIFIQGSRVLACRRALHKSAPGLWEFPGGKVDDGEEPHMAIVREIKEELGLDCVALSTFDISNTSVGQQIIRLETVLCKMLATQQLKSTDHDAFEWVSAGESQKLAWANPDLPALDRLIKEKMI